jgi:hypothetical protein
VIFIAIACKPSGSIKWQRIFQLPPWSYLAAYVRTVGIPEQENWFISLKTKEDKEPVT